MTTILIVDDSSDIRNSLRRWFVSLHGATVYVAYDGQCGYDEFRAHANEIDFVVTDIQMPRMSGLELLRAIHVIAPAMPVFLMSGLRRKDFDLPADAAGFFSKPFCPDEAFMAGLAACSGSRTD